MNLRPSGYEPDELPGCSTPRQLRPMWDSYFDIVLERTWIFTRFGGDLLSHGLNRSTIGATELNGRVRDGIGCFSGAVTTKPSKNPSYPSQVRCMCMLLIYQLSFALTGSNQAYRAISTGQLNALLRLHLRPIDVVVFHGSQGYLVLRGASRLDAFSGYPFRS